MIATPIIPVDAITFASDLLMVRNKQRQLVPLRYNRAQLHYLQNRTRRDLIVKARQLGFSTLIQAEAYRESTTSAQSTITLADKDENTAKLRRIQQTFYDNLPPAMPKPIRSVDNAAVTVYPETGSEVAIATAGSKTSGRASTYTRLHGSEVAYWKDANWVIAGALQALPERGSYAVMESTGNGTQGWFYETTNLALRGNSEWTVHFYAWWWDDDYWLPLEVGESLDYEADELELIAKHNLSPEQIKWRRAKQGQLHSLFQQEYPETVQNAFLTSGRGVFNTQHIELFYDRQDAPAEPQEGHTYVMAVDWGQYPDFTAASVWDVEEYREVELFRTGSRDYEAMIEDIVQLASHWRVSHITPEFNSIGRVTVTILARRITETMTDRPPTMKAFDMTNKRKDDLVKLFQQGIIDGLRLIDDPVGNQELAIYEASQTATGLWSYSAPDNQHDDTVIARMLGHWACFSFKNNQ